MKLDTIICGDCLEVMKDWPDGFIDCCVTSPPYWGLRDYGIEGQLGLEKTPEEYIEKMVAVFREVRRVLKKTGTLWLNMGDSYATSPAGNKEMKAWKDDKTGKSGRYKLDNYRRDLPKEFTGLKPKDLCMMPHRLAMALQKDGWWIRSDTVWAKPNPMPESVTDRPTKSHEYIFLCTKSAKYYYDADAIREDAKDAESYSGRKFRGPKAILEAGARPGNSQTIDKGNPADDKTYAKVNKRSVWTVATAPYSEAHFATFPPKLIEPCILAGCPEWVCKKCGKAKERIVDTKYEIPTTRPSSPDIDRKRYKDSKQTMVGYRPEKVYTKNNKTTGWTDCKCNAGFDGGIVFDPFMGSGTTAVVAYENRRHYLGIELNQEYIDLGRIDKVKAKYGLFE